MANPTALVGYTGFVGGNLAAQHHFDELYDISNITEGFDKPHSLVVYAGVPAEKFLANSDPAADLALIETAKENLRRLQPERVILISTVDVYRDPVGLDEYSDMQRESLHPYGADRLLLEDWVRVTFPGSLVVRLPALFGKGLKKNFIFDLCRIVPSMLKPAKYEELCAKSPLVGPAYADAGNGFYKLKPLCAEDFAALKAFFEANDFNALAFTDSRAAYQFYCLDHLWADISRAAEAGLTLVNITSEPMTAAAVFLALKGREFTNEFAPVPVRYDLRTAHCGVMGGRDGYIYTAAEVLPELIRFVQANS
ncbi:MAG: NAD(P)-dependent oxidoreductase [Oscillospiraceae bacterium]|nr:NAD(P)-dependent oxidoreductase [Oscillospiraceae bacterium]